MSKDKVNYWLLADTHFGHEKLGGHLGWPKDFAQKILKQVSLIVGPRDVLIHLGDVCFYDEGYWHDLLRASHSGKQWLIRGNHDKKSYGWYLDHGWDMVAESLRLDLYGKDLFLTHKPIETEFGPASTRMINIHGHIHLRETEFYYKKVIATERTLRPISLRKVVESSEHYF